MPRVGVSNSAVMFNNGDIAPRPPWASTDVRQSQVRYLMRGINGGKLGLKCLNVGKNIDNIKSM